MTRIVKRKLKSLLLHNWQLADKVCVVVVDEECIAVKYGIILQCGPGYRKNSVLYRIRLEGGKEVLKQAENVYSVAHYDQLVSSLAATRWVVRMVI